ncbi:pre-rRNA 2'-O-ribose RNA methyltransferase FTSJ3-like isoform X2 [Littorina saxatilis]|uniref:pre-rRNA 2'-O-ribose RNA methyltransferase FTSJ3-like isoform X2 n=1 Tax=Littorina saxatilis TaxID=31220 RepID=UPI0038B48110
MGKKTKVGKARKDKFYKLAKETGYRSRASFKLIQLNKKYGFLNKARVVIDLCAAPGGWMQVVAENTPVSSLIVGVDLVSIKPIDRCISMQEDITTDKCRQSLKKSLQTWQADCVLNDGAPNVGKNWMFDAYTQSDLTLSALKLATEFLRKGGWFVTKVFRSKDYFALDWVFRQLFKKVWATKPQASRSESAEIFVVCESYLAPDKLDPKFLDPKHVFKDVQMEPNRALNLMHPEKPQRHREGYAEGDFTLFHKLMASEYISSEDFMEKLAACNMIELDDEEIANSEATTVEIKQCLQDIKVLGRKEIKALLRWRKDVLKQRLKAEKAEKARQQAAKLLEEAGQEVEGEVDEESDHEGEEQELDEALTKAHEEDRKTSKRKKRKERKLLAKKRHRLDLKMDLPGDKLDFGDETGAFSLSKIRSKQALDTVQEGDLSFMDGDILEDDDDDAAADMILKKRKLLEAYDKNTKHYIDSSEYPSDEEGLEEPSLLEMEEDDNQSDEEENGDNNPLVVEMESKDSKARSRTANWFSKGAFEGLEKDEDEVAELEAMTADYEERGGTVLDKDKKKEQKKNVHFTSEDQTNGHADDDDDDDDDEDDDDDDDDDSSDDDDDDSEEESYEEMKRPDLEVVPMDKASLKLNPVGLAMGTAMVRSRKRRREIIESGYNRNMRGEGEDLPDWFSRDEKKHCHRQMPVTKEEVNEYMMKQRAIDARPIKKLAEAKARKKKKVSLWAVCVHVRFCWTTMEHLF